MEDFTVNVRSDSDTFKKFHPSSSDEQALKGCNVEEKGVLRKSKRTRRKKKKSSSKKSKSLNQNVGWGVLAPKNVSSEEDTEEPFSSEKSNADTLRNAISTTSGDDTDNCFYSKNRQMGDVTKSVSKNTKKLEKGSKLNSSLQRIDTPIPDYSRDIIEDRRSQLTTRIDVLQKKNKKSTSSDIQDSDNCMIEEQNETTNVFVNTTSRQSRIQKPSPITRQSKIKYKSLSQSTEESESIECIEFDNEETPAVIDKSLRRQTRYLNISPMKQVETEVINNTLHRQTRYLNKSPMKQGGTESPTKNVLDGFAYSDHEFKNQANKSTAKKQRKNTVFVQDHKQSILNHQNKSSSHEKSTISSDSEINESDPPKNNIITEKKVSSVFVQDQKQRIHDNLHKSPVHDKSRIFTKEVDRKSNKTENYINHNITDHSPTDSTTDSNDQDSNLSKNSTVKEKSVFSTVLNSELSHISILDDGDVNVTIENTPFLKLKPVSTSTEIKKKRTRSNSITPNKTDEKILMNETFTSENPIAVALKEFKFETGDLWTDPKSHTFCGADIPPAEDEKRETYDLQRTVIGLSTLKTLEDNEQTSQKRSSIGQRIAKQNKRTSGDKLSTTLKAKGKMKEKKSQISKQFAKGVLNDSKKNVTFNESVSTKIKPTKMPNFSKIHRQQLDRSESLVDYVQRKQERSLRLLSGGKSFNTSKVATPKISNISIKEQVASESLPGCSHWNNGSVKSKKPDKNKATLIRLDAFDCDTDADSDKEDPPPLVTPQKKRVTYFSSLDDNDMKPTKVFAKTPGNRKYNPEISNIDPPISTEKNLPSKSPRILKGQGKTFLNKTPQKNTVDSFSRKRPETTLQIKNDKTPKRISPKLVKTPKIMSPKVVKTPKRISPKVVKTPKRISPKMVKTPKRTPPKSGPKMVLVTSPKSPITKLLPTKLFQSTASTQGNSGRPKKKLLSVVAPKSRGVQNKSPAKKIAGMPKPVGKENNVNVNNTNQQSSTSSAMEKVVKENLQKKKIKTRLDKEALKTAVNKQRVVQAEDSEQKREVLKGMRSNRRFDLLMKFRNKK